MMIINIKVIQDLNVQSIKNQHNYSLVSQMKQPCRQRREEALRVPCCKVHNYVYVCQLHLSYQPEWTVRAIDQINPNSQSVSKWSIQTQESAQFCEWLQRRQRGFTAAVLHSCSSLCLQVESQRSSISLYRASSGGRMQDECICLVHKVLHLKVPQLICERLFNRREVPNRQICRGFTQLKQGEEASLILARQCTLSDNVKKCTS